MKIITLIFLLAACLCARAEDETQRYYAAILSAFTFEGDLVSYQFTSPLRIPGEGGVFLNFETCEKYAELRTAQIMSNDPGGLFNIRCVDLTVIFETFDQVQSAINRRSDDKSI